MPEENNRIEEKLDKLIEATRSISDKVSGLEKRVDKIEKRSPEKAFMYSDVPPKPAYDKPLVAYKEASPTAPGEAVRSGAAAAPVKNAIFNSGKQKIKAENFESEIGIKWLGRIGILALIFGVSFFLKYAFDNDWIGETGRVAIGLVAGLALLVAGDRLRGKYASYAQILTGGGVAILYLSIYSAFAYYHLIDQLPAFAVMAFITFAGAFLAINYGSAGLAVLSISGGFLTPMLLSTGVNNQLGLFIYITLLNLGILAISFFRNWKALNLLGFTGTILLYSGWAAGYYTSDQLLITEIFLTLWFIIYAVATISHNILAKKNTDQADMALIVLNALAYFLISYSLLSGSYSDFMGFFAVLMAFVYFVFAYISYQFNPEDKNLALFMPAFSIFFLTIAAPIQFDGHWVTISWAIESMALIWISYNLKRPEMGKYAWAIFIIVLARLIFVDMQIDDIGAYAIIFNARVLTFAIGIISVAVFYRLYSFYDEKSKARENSVKVKLLFIANFLAILILSAEVQAFFSKQSQTIPFPPYPICQESTYEQGLGNRENPYCQQRYEEYDRVQQEVMAKRRSIESKASSSLSVLWGFYAIILLAFGIARKSRPLRLMGIGLLGITIFKLFFYDLWSLGTLYKIISSITMGVILLAASFAYSKYKDKIKEII